MKLALLAVLVLSLIITAIVITSKKKMQEIKKTTDCLTTQNFFLIRDSPYAKELSKYLISSEENKLRFSLKEEKYTLFYLVLEEEESETVKLIGLDGYGIRDKEFLKYICNLVSNILNNAPE